MVRMQAIYGRTRYYHDNDRMLYSLDHQSYWGTGAVYSQNLYGQVYDRARLNQTSRDYITHACGRTILHASGGVTHADEVYDDKLNLVRHPLISDGCSIGWNNCSPTVGYIQPQTHFEIEVAGGYTYIHENGTDAASTIESNITFGKNSSSIDIPADMRGGAGFMSFSAEPCYLYLYSSPIMEVENYTFNAGLISIVDDIGYGAYKMHGYLKTKFDNRLAKV